MLRSLKETWLPTVLLAGFGALLATADRDAGVIHYAAAVAWIIVPLLWKSFVIRQGRPRVRRAAIAGAASAFMIVFADMMIDSVLQFLHQGRNASEDIAGVLVLFIPFWTLVVFLFGAGVASLVAFVQARMWPGSPDDLGTTDSRLDGAVGGALSATLIAPFLAIFFVALMPNKRAPTMNLLTATAGTWLILAPVGAWLGSRAVRRWRRILGGGAVAN